MFPFTFLEYTSFIGIAQMTVDELFVDYMKWGGLPQRCQFKNETEIRTYLGDVYSSIVMHDIINHSTTLNTNKLRKIIDYIFENNANVFSAKSVYNHLYQSDKSYQSAEIYKGIDRIIDSMICSKCERFDIKGKEVLSFYEKYYIVDLGLKNYRGTNYANIGFSLETIIYNELRARGYDLFVGKTYNGEVDFIASSNGKKCFIQVTYLLSEQSVIDREFKAFSPIKDSSPKYVLSMDKFDFSRDGIVHLNIIDFLLRKKDLVLL